MISEKTEVFLGIPQGPHLRLWLFNIFLSVGSTRLLPFTAEEYIPLKYFLRYNQWIFQKSQRTISVPPQSSIITYRATFFIGINHNVFQLQIVHHYLNNLLFTFLLVIDFFCFYVSYLDRKLKKNVMDLVT